MKSYEILLLDKFEYRTLLIPMDLLTMYLWSYTALQAQELANKDAAYKESQIKLEALEKHCEVQQQLLQHACNLEHGFVGAHILPEEDDMEDR